MESGPERLIATAVRTLDFNAELQLASAAELQRLIAEQGAASEAELAAAGEAFARADARPRRKRWRWLVWWLMALIALPLVGRALFHYVVLGQYLLWVSDPSGVTRYMWIPEVGRSVERPDAFLFGGLDPEQRLLMGGGWGATSLARAEEYWRGAPDDPGRFEEYAVTWLHGAGRLPADYGATAARIDPDNGWFPLMAALAAARDDPPQGFKGDSVFGKAPEWKIQDPACLEEALALLHKAMAYPRLQSYRSSLLLQRGILLPEPRSYLEQVALRRCRDLWPSTCWHWGNLRLVIAAGAQECARRDDREAFLRLLDDWRRCSAVLVDQSIDVLDLLYARSFVTGPLRNLRDAARVLGCEAEAGQLAAVEERLRFTELRYRGSGDLNRGLAAERGPLLANPAVCPSRLLVRQWRTISAEDLRPGLRAEHALYQRFFTVAAWAVTVLFAGVAAWQRFRHGALTRVLSGRMLDLLGRRDWWWIVAAGGIGPVLWHAAVTRLTPLTARDWSLGGAGLYQAVGQTASMLVLLLVLPPVIAAWRLARRGRVFGFDRGMARHWLGKVAVGCAVLALPAFGVPMWEAYANQEGIVLLPCVVLGLAVLWWLGLVLGGWFGPRASALRRAVVFRGVLPAWGVAMLVLGVSLAVHETEEREWVSQDSFLRPSVAVPSMTRHEAEFGRDFRRELRDLVKELGP